MLEKDLEARTELTSMSYAAEVFLRMLNPVSYTHRDVYKRQGRACTLP